jgi:hypothetical protein
MARFDMNKEERLLWVIGGLALLMIVLVFIGIAFGETL